MTFSFNVNDVLPAVHVASSIINKKNSMPILDNLFLEVDAEKKRMRIIGSDTETEVSIPVALIDASETRTLCVNSARFLKALSRLTNHTLTIDVRDDGEIKCKYAIGDFSMAYEPSEAYPLMSITGDVKSFTFNDANVLHKGLKSTLFATANDEIRPVMTGVEFDIKEGSVIFVGTDGRLLVRNTTKVENSHVDSFILPKKPANLLQNLTAKENSSVKVAYNDKVVAFVSDKFVIQCRLIDGHYPNYNSVIPQHHEQHAKVNRADLLSALSRISVFAPNTELVVISFVSTEGQMHLSSQDFDYSTSAEERVYCEYSGDAMKVGVKASILDALLRSLDCEQVEMHMGGSARAIVFTPIVDGDTSSEITALVMPMKID